MFHKYKHFSTKRTGFFDIFNNLYKFYIKFINLSFCRTKYRQLTDMKKEERLGFDSTLFSVLYLTPHIVIKCRLLVNP